MGLGLAAVRDILSFFKYETHDLLGNPNPLLHEVRGIKKMPIEFNYIYGISQSGRFIVHMISQGFHIDEKDRMVFDGARIQVAGGGKGGFNFRFAQPTHHPSDLEGNYMPADFPPFNYLAENDPESGGKNDVLAVVEVKTRSSNYFGNPQDFVNQKKIKLLVEAINEYVISKDLDVEVRFDIVAILKNQKEFKIEHLEDAFLYF